MSHKVKRSRSAPENDEPSTPTNSRQARSVKFKDEPNKPMKTRSRSEHRPQRIMASIDHYAMCLEVNGLNKKIQLLPDLQ